MSSFEKFATKDIHRNLRTARVAESPDYYNPFEGGSKATAEHRLTPLLAPLALGVMIGVVVTAAVLL